MQGELLTVLLVAIVLGADAFSLSMGMGLKGVSRRYEIRFSSLVALFHVLMPLVGLSLGVLAGKYWGAWAGRAGAVVLAYIGLEMLWKAYGEIRPRSFAFSHARKLLNQENKDINEGWTSLLLPTISVSIDALTVGFSLGTIKAPVLTTISILGLIAGSMTMLGFKAGKIFSRLIGSYSQAVGGLVLVALAIKMSL